MNKAHILLGKNFWGLVFFASVIMFNCTEEQPLTIKEQNLGDIVGIIKPIGIVAMVKVSQGIPIDSTYSDSTSGYFKIDSLQVGFYTLEIKAEGYGKYVENQIQVVANGITSIGDIYLKPIPEQILYIIPYDGSENIELTAPCGFEFVTFMDHMSVENNFEITPTVNGYFQWIENRNDCALYFYPIPQYKAFTIYNFSLSTGAKTIYGDTLSFPINSAFTTEPVKVDGTNPEDGATFVNTSASIYIRFNTSMDKTSVENSFRIIETIAGNFLWHNNESFSFKPSTFLATNKQYSVTLTTNAKDIYGNSLGEPLTFSFTTEPLRITYTFPSNGATNISKNTTIQIMFNTNIDQSSAENAFSITPTISGKFAWSDLTKFTYYPDTLLEPNTLYTVTISTNCKDSYGEGLAEDYSFSFTTEL